MLRGDAATLCEDPHVSITCRGRSRKWAHPLTASAKIVAYTTVLGLLKTVNYAPMQL